MKMALPDSATPSRLTQGVILMTVAMLTTPLVDGLAKRLMSVILRSFSAGREVVSQFG